MNFVDIKIVTLKKLKHSCWSGVYVSITFHTFNIILYYNNYYFIIPQKYTLTLSEQLLKNAKSNVGFGKNLDVNEGILDSFTDDQILQLYNMLKETTGIQDQTIETELFSQNKSEK